ncbi:ATP-binding protein [Flavobacterium sp.]|uniref:ATP-binding protein n=1 Tax=Flavobacterium sp. TaxID=239 RepID=UPI0025CD21FD|nr:ATP-binding protein [Flavobacterium sp.]
MLIFAQHDLVKNPPYCNMHLISCRNVLIYMAPALQAKVYAMLLFGLKTNGYLYLGTSESPLTIMDSLEEVNKKWRIYKSLKNKRSATFETFSLPELLDVRRSGSYNREDTVKHMTNLMTDNVNTVLAESMNYLAICVDQENTVLKSYGNTAKYLVQQNFNNNLIELLPKPLAVAYNALSKEVLKTDVTTNVKGIMVKQNNTAMAVNLSVSPLLLDSGHKGFVAVFNDETSLSSKKENYPVFDEKEYHTKYTDTLEEELKKVKSELVDAYEKLETSNENMQSFNEELISSNEEMQSTNEEMQSVNEELHTINADYQLKNKELLETNDDLNNYFRSNINGQLFIDNEMKLMKFSPGAVKHINLLDTDIGRPITHISTNIKFETIIADTKLVLEKGVVISKEIEAENGKWYQIMIMPYIQATHRNKGAIITFNDITELNQTQTELKRKNQSLLRINADLDHFIHAASHDLLAPLGNIEASINILNEELPQKEVAVSEFLGVINNSIRTFRSLINDIATIAKVESDMIVTEEVNLNEIIDNIEWSLRNEMAEAKIKIVRNLEIPSIQFSKKNMRSILFNLISNAIKFRSKKSPMITVSTFNEGDYCVLTVEDNGKGIPKESHDKIFEMYGRLHQDIEGSGIGLYLAKKIVNAAEGSIRVESEPDKGTKFIIRLTNQIHKVL